MDVVAGWLRPDLRFVFPRQVYQTHRTHIMQGIIFADVRWIMNAIYATNILVVWSEACLAPMAIYVEQLSLIAAMRITTAIPKNNITTTMLP